jgi:hypothetical protein
VDKLEDFKGKMEQLVGLQKYTRDFFDNLKDFLNREEIWDNCGDMDLKDHTTYDVGYHEKYESHWRHTLSGVDVHYTYVASFADDGDTETQVYISYYVISLFLEGRFEELTELVLKDARRRKVAADGREITQLQRHAEALGYELVQKDKL